MCCCCCFCSYCCSFCCYCKNFKFSQNWISNSSDIFVVVFVVHVVVVIIVVDPTNLLLKFNQNRVRNSWDIDDIEFVWWWWWNKVIFLSNPTFELSWGWVGAVTVGSNTCLDLAPAGVISFSSPFSVFPALLIVHLKFEYMALNQV